MILWQKDRQIEWLTDRLSETSRSTALKMKLSNILHISMVKWSVNESQTVISVLSKLTWLKERTPKKSSYMGEQNLGKPRTGRGKTNRSKMKKNHSFRLDQLFEEILFAMCLPTNNAGLWHSSADLTLILLCACARRLLMLPAALLKMFSFRVAGFCPSSLPTWKIQLH